MAAPLIGLAARKAIKKAALGMYEGKKINENDNKNIKILKKISKKDIHINVENNNFYIHHDLKGLLKNILNVKNPIFVTGGTDIALEVTKRNNDLNNISAISST